MQMSSYWGVRNCRGKKNFAARKPIDPCKQNKERTNGLHAATPAVTLADLTKFENDCVSRNGWESTLPNQIKWSGDSGGVTLNFAINCLAINCKTEVQPITNRVWSHPSCNNNRDWLNSIFVIDYNILCYTPCYHSLESLQKTMF